MICLDYLLHMTHRFVESWRVWFETFWVKEFEAHYMAIVVSALMKNVMTVKMCAFAGNLANKATSLVPEIRSQVVHALNSILDWGGDSLTVADSSGLYKCDLCGEVPSS